jgi:hypothetical protein
VSTTPPKPVRSPSYPNASLSEAIASVRKIEKLYRSSPVDREVAAKLIGYSSLSGPANQALAALAQYGLVERAGKGEMRVTSRAQAILHPNSDNEQKDQLRAAALEPQLFRELQERFPNMTPPEDGVLTYLNRQGFNQSAIRPAAKAYLQTLLFLEESGASDSHGSSKADEPKPATPEGDGSSVTHGSARVGDLIDYEVGGAIANPEPMRVRALSADQAWVFVDGSTTGLEMEQVIVRERAAPFPPQVAMEQAFGKLPPTLPLPSAQDEAHGSAPAKGYRSETFDADEGTIKITWPENLSAQSVEDMKDWLELLKRRIERRATLKDLL